MGNSFGQLFKITTFGESHGRAVGVVVDGCPAGLKLDITELQKELDRRRPGQSTLTTQRKEPDTVEILSGLFDGYTTGMPLTLVIYNTNQRSQDYDHLAEAFRPSHADFTYHTKYQWRDYRGGGRSSARETVARVAAGAIAKQLLHKLTNINILSWVESVGKLKMPDTFTEFSLADVESNDVRCPHPPTAEHMALLIKQIRKEGDTIGGVVGCKITGVPAGLGEPVFDKLHADLAKAMLSINAAKGFEYGSGFMGTELRGSEHNDIFYHDGKQIRTRTNYSGGIQGGISNGEDVYFRVAFKPVATLIRTQESITTSGEPTLIEGKGRHDPCVLPRAVPIVDAMAALVLVDHYLQNSYVRKL